MTRNLYALLVGIDQYSGPVKGLNGCVNDIHAIEAYLQNRSGGEFQLKPRRLLNEQATRAALIAGFREHLAAAGPQDVALFYYSGHGSQQPSPSEFWPLEPDHLDETLVCHDSRSTSWDLADKELSVLIAEIAQRGPHVVVVLDCCHSGSGTRAGLTELQTAERRIPTDTRPRPLDSYLFSIDQLAGVRSPEPTANRSGWLTLPEGRHVLLAACQSGETAKEYSAEGQHWGAFSYFLRTTLESARGQLTYQDLHKSAGNRLLTSWVAQTPQLEVSDAADVQLPFLGGAIEALPHYFTLRSELGRWVIDGGAVHGLPAPAGADTTRLAIYALDAPAADLRNRAAAIGYVSVVEVRPQDSRVTIDDGAAIPAGPNYKAVVTHWPLPPLKVHVQGEADGVAVMRAALATGEPGDGSAVQVGDSTADFWVWAVAGEYLITRPASERPLIAPVAGYTPTNAQLLVRRLEHIARWTRTADLKHPSARLASELLPIRLIADGQERTETAPVLTYHFINGAWQQPSYVLELQNNTAERLYCAVLGLWESFGIEAGFFPAGGIWLEPGQSVQSQRMYASVPETLWQAGVTERRDVLKLIACTAEFDARLLAQPPLDAPRLAHRGLEPNTANPLNQLFLRLQTREGSDQPETGPLDDWMTSELVMTIRRPRLGQPVPHAGPPIMLGAGVTLEPHPSLSAEARLTSAPAASRAAGGLGQLLPSLLATDPAVSEPLMFAVSRGGDPGLSVLELSQVSDYQVVTPEQPLRLIVDQRLAAGERVLPIGFDGQFYLPLGSSQVVNGQLALTLDRLPAPLDLGTRDLTGTICILFQKLVAQPLGLDYPYPILASATVDSEGNVTYEAEPQKVAAQVLAATRITVYVHGFTGDTRGMLAGAPALQPGELLLAFDYESINTSIENLARGLKQRLAAVGLKAGHPHGVELVAHSLGGLVARWFIEREGGYAFVRRLVILGSPSAGTPWPTVQQWATLGIGLALNSLSTVAWPLKAVGALVSAFETIDVTLDQIQPGSDFLKALAESDDPHVPYILIGGNTSIIPTTLVSAGETPGALQQLAQRLGLGPLVYRLLDLAFFNYPNDFTVSVRSVHSVDALRQPPPVCVEVACDHITYFVSAAGRQALAAALQAPLPPRP